VGIYFESDVGDAAVVQFVTNMHELEVTEIEHWQGYPLEVVGGKLLLTESAPFSRIIQTLKSKQNEQCIFLIKGKVRKGGEQFTFYVNGNRVMEDKTQYAFEFDSDHVDITDEKWEKWLRLVARKIYENLNLCIVAVGFSDDCINPKYEKPRFVMVEHMEID